MPLFLTFFTLSPRIKYGAGSNSLPQGERGGVPLRGLI